MRALIDTSSLFKKYADEMGSVELAALLDSVFELIVSPVTIIEMHSIIERRVREKSLRLSDAKWIEQEFSIDYGYFGVVEWNDDLLKESIRIIRKHQIRVLDSIQLASGVVSKAEMFITSDRRLHAVAIEELSLVHLI